MEVPIFACFAGLSYGIEGVKVFWGQLEGKKPKKRGRKEAGPENAAEHNIPLSAAEAART